jgi:peptidoglycan/xylan/chitin deacetylase (PgdA/CDA1 family)
MHVCRAAGHITGQCIPVDDACLLWRSTEASAEHINLRDVNQLTAGSATSRPRRMRICITVDFDALSGYLGTGHMPENTLSYYSAGIFSANVGVNRLLKIFKKYGISQNVTWFIPGHSMESFPRQTLDIVNSGAEIGLHGYSHESLYAMNVEQERDVLAKCIELASNLPGGKRPVGYRAPLYQIRESTINLPQEYGMLYDSSMNHYDSVPYLLTRPYSEEVPHIPDYNKPASTWTVPFFPPGQPAPGSEEAASAIVAIPGSWYTEDLTPMGFYPHTASTQGYMSVGVVEKMWLNRFNWLWEQESWIGEDSDSDWETVYPLILPPECSGRSHTAGMLDHFIEELTAKMRQADQAEITFETMQSVAKSWKERPAA